MPDTSRRALLTAAAVSPSALFLPALADQGTAIHDPGLLRCIADYRRAKNVADTWEETVFAPAHQAYREAVDAIPHYQTKASYENVFGKRAHLSTESSASVLIADRYRKDANVYGNDEYATCCEELVRALDDRNAMLESLSEQWRASGLTDRSDALNEHWIEKAYAAIGYPVRTVADLLLKLDVARSLDDDTVSIEDLLCDLRRIDGRA